MISIEYYQFFYAISLTIKSLIIFLLPVVIFGLLFKTVINLAKDATKIIGFILCGVFISSLIVLIISYLVGDWVYSFNLAVLLPNKTHELQPLWLLEIPSLISNSYAMICAILLGLIFNYSNNLFIKKYKQLILDKLEFIVNKILKIFIYLIPLFIIGFLAKLQYDGLIVTIIKNYFFIFAIIIVSQFSYLFLVYFLLNNANFKQLIISINNMLPAFFSGLSTMSSAATMPLTIMGVAKNTENKDLACSLVPATVNIHLIGDCFAIPILSFAILKTYGILEPSITNYIVFVFYFILAKFSVAAVPGGGIIVMLPILQNYLGFNVEMMSLITALYILFDPIVTSVNILGNGAFAKTMDKLLGCSLKKKPLIN